MPRSPRPTRPVTPPQKGRGGKKKASGCFSRLLHALRLAVVAFLVITVVVTFVFRFVPPPGTPLMVLRLGEQWLDHQPLKIHKSWRPLSTLAPAMATAVIASEDQRFFEHHGFDFDAIFSAFHHNRGAGHRTIGASTITQQTAKNLFLWPDRSWARKGLEVYFTVLLELLWSKSRILEVYLNIAETGRGMYGMAAAANTYYHMDASDLNADQAAWIAACLPNPLAWTPASPPRHVIRRQAWILRQMAFLGPLPTH